MKRRNTLRDEVILTISNDGKGALFGNMQSGSDIDKKNVEFSPITVLGDLLTTTNYVEKSIYRQDNYTLNQNYSEHPFLQGKKIHGVLEKSYFVALVTLQDVFDKVKPLTMNEFEIIRQFHSLNLTHRILFREENPMYGMTDLVEKHTWIKNSTTERYQYKTLDYRESFDEDNMLEQLFSAPYKFEYRCYRLEDIIFSVLHYLAFFKYKFAKCNHCERYYATQTYKTKYCNRKSPHEEYNHLECEQAVKDIKQLVARRKKSIEEHLKVNYKDLADDFHIKYHELRDPVKTEPTVENLNKIIQFTDKTNIKKYWYKKENRNPRTNTGAEYKKRQR